MRPIGFSTGALARGNFSRGLELLREAGLRKIELSALRTEELPGLMHYIRGTNLDGFDYVSIHAPSAYPTDSELGIVEGLTPAIKKGFHVVVHPDAIRNFRPWRTFGRLLCVENMDKRKPIGRTVRELSEVFDELPEASFCLDVAHTRQVDPTMGVAADLLRHFAGRLAQVHVSDVNSNSRHERLNLAATLAYRKIAASIPASVPLVLESPLYSEPESRMQDEIAAEVARAEDIFSISGAVSEQEISDVWRSFRQHRTQSLRKLLVMEYLPMVKYQAERLYSKLPDEFDLDDLIQAGAIGLKDAIETFDPEGSVKFETYCALRIRNAILDELPNREAEILEGKISDSPLAILHQRDLKEIITRGLSRAERLIMILYYYEEMTMKEIGAALNLSEDQVRRMHWKIIGRVKKQMADRDSVGQSSREWLRYRLLWRLAASRRQRLNSPSVSTSVGNNPQ